MLHTQTPLLSSSLLRGGGMHVHVCTQAVAPYSSTGLAVTTASTASSMMRSTSLSRPLFLKMPASSAFPSFIFRHLFSKLCHLLN